MGALVVVVVVGGGGGSSDSVSILLTELILNTSMMAEMREKTEHRIEQPPRSHQMCVGPFAHECCGPKITRNALC
jgi:hypothetical protein